MDFFRFFHVCMLVTICNQFCSLVPSHLMYSAQSLDVPIQVLTRQDRGLVRTTIASSNQIRKASLPFSKNNSIIWECSKLQRVWQFNVTTSQESSVYSKSCKERCSTGVHLCSWGSPNLPTNLKVLDGGVGRSEVGITGYQPNISIKIHFAKWGPSETLKVQFRFFKLFFCFLAQAFKNV